MPSLCQWGDIVNQRLPSVRPIPFSDRPALLAESGPATRSTVFLDGLVASLLGSCNFANGRLLRSSFVVVAMLAFVLSGCGSPSTATHQYWSELQKVSARLDAVEQQIDESKLQSPTQASYLMRQMTR